MNHSKSRDEYKVKRTFTIVIKKPLSGRSSQRAREVIKVNAREIEKCIDAFGTDIYRFCLKLCADKADAEDLYQQTFLKALETEWTLDWESNPKALFFSLAHNLWKSDRRKQARRSTIAGRYRPICRCNESF